VQTSYYVSMSLVLGEKVLLGLRNVILIVIHSVIMRGFKEIVEKVSSFFHQDERAAMA
jgi:hypothetical protein